MTREELLQIAKPILFNSEMVRAILDRRKTVTRRIIKLPYGFSGHVVGEIGNKENPLGFMYPGGIKRPPYQPGDILYVRETWNHYVHNIVAGSKKGFHEERYFYKASPEMKSKLPDFVQYHWGEKWKPSIHMPKEAARIFLKVKDVRVKRLQDMMASDVSKEGVKFNKPYTADEMLDEFVKLWNSTINKDELEQYGWNANPWVWVIEFERIEV